MELDTFSAALHALGTSNEERAHVLDMPGRSFDALKARKLGKQIRRLMRRPELLRALADDAERVQRPTSTQRTQLSTQQAAQW